MNTARNHSKMFDLTSLAAANLKKLKSRLMFVAMQNGVFCSRHSVPRRRDAIMRKQRTRSLQNAGRNNCAATLIRFPSRVNNFLRKYVHA